MITVFEGVKVGIKSFCYYKETDFFGFPSGMEVIVVFFAAACDTNNSYYLPPQYPINQFAIPEGNLGITRYILKKCKKNVFLTVAISKMLIFAAQIETNYCNN